jgi:hypothetical protein
MRIVAAFLFLMLAIVTPGADDKKLQLGDVAERAVQQSKLTLSSSKAFHLKATIGETTNADSDYKATVEEFWVSPTKWKRVIVSPDFSQTLIVNGDAVSEQDTGDYFPLWLNQLATAMLDPLPMLAALKDPSLKITTLQGGENSNTCADLRSRVDRWTVCFEGSHGLLNSFFTKGYAVEFKDYKKFGEKRVARRLTTDPEPGTHLEAHITELTELNQPDEQMFAIPHPTPPKEQIRSAQLDEDTFRSLLISSTEINWPPQGGGPATGGCAVYVSADRTGHVRETWPAGCDSTGIEDFLRKELKNWRLKPAVSARGPVQVEALLGFTFHTQVDRSHPLPELSDADARALATNIVEPIFPSGSADKGTEISVQISVDETGKLTGVGNPQDLKDSLFLTAYAALTKWHFKPYLKDNKPQYFHADLVFHVQ